MLSASFSSKVLLLFHAANGGGERLDLLIRFTRFDFPIARRHLANLRVRLLELFLEVGDLLFERAKHFVRLFPLAEDFLVLSIDDRLEFLHLSVEIRRRLLRPLPLLGGVVFRKFSAKSLGLDLLEQHQNKFGVALLRPMLGDVRFDCFEQRLGVGRSWVTH